MTDSLVKSQEKGLTLRMVAEMTGFAPADIALVARTVAVGAPLQELAVFLHSCRQLRLDPLLRQAFWIRRGDPPKGTLQVGIDGFRAIADSSGAYAGGEVIEFRGAIDWEYRKQTILVPEFARATVWKIVAGHKAAFVGEAAWSEFVPSERDAFMWAKMPRHMLGKVAEAQALRRAFPAQLGALDLADDQPATGSSEAPTPSQAELAAKHAAIYDHAYDLPEAALADTLTSRASAQARYRELVAQAAELQLDVPPLGARATTAQIDKFNAELAERISQAEPSDDRD